MDSILFSVENGIATIRLNRPEVYNSFNREMALLMQQYLKECTEEGREGPPEIRAVIITGEGKAFSAGQDLQEIVAENGPDIATILSEHYNPIIQHIRSLEKPVICAVNGVAAGAGANIALACDIVLAAESASFIQAFSKIGLIPDSGGTFFLPRLIGLQRAAALMMTGEKVPAKEAQNMGMIYRAVPDRKLMSEALALASQLAQMPTKGLGLTKRALNRSLESTLDKQLAMEEELQIAASQTHDFKEGVQAFLEKRKPDFKGQ
ncbi:MAG TPA: 2-(1,2-epoxy-1,2-dihydrophenyl)acetyl-CoA isomerase [Phaeodactylibacter sp.]|nr:2-(1,2-epoxy-1,2-dihydrophenyl)acetyl-CoA isomerase [Phaeodactylibacter sp.]